MSVTDFSEINSIIEDAGWKAALGEPSDGWVSYSGPRTEYELVFSNWDTEDDCTVALKEVSSAYDALAGLCELSAVQDKRAELEKFLDDMEYRYLSDWD